MPIGSAQECLPSARVVPIKMLVQYLIYRCGPFKSSFQPGAR